MDTSKCTWGTFWHGYAGASKNILKTVRYEGLELGYNICLDTRIKKVASYTANMMYAISTTYKYVLVNNGTITKFKKAE